ncbi:hypothetical protein [Thermophilibacter immobilis]|uniref:Uncharacterized protein n=1 Tax=Thermophilibacter immobilis TaxID=2779519 RepID=A0A7S7M739_9ACTN|nr:hypothetical protein [Thermophilibacter immobilis]QOY59991.1 hypothetical protein INP52_06035 [Thermophilibacter immobilis]
MVQRRNPAVVAGLAGAFAWGVPASAQALSVSDLARAAVSPEGSFVAGLVCGTVLTGGVATTIALARRHRRTRAQAPLAPADPEKTNGRALEGKPASEQGDKPSRRPRHLAPEASDPDPARGADRPEDVSSPRQGPGHAARDYEDIAENYVRRASFRERMSRRAQGVAATLKERMDADMMDGLPVIERADGSVGDVGTSWWQTAVGSGSIISDAGFAPDDAIPSDFSSTGRELLVNVERARERDSIARRVAFVDNGVYPERRGEGEPEDVWTSALRSLDEKIAAESPLQDPIGFVDAAGDADSLDEPDDLEAQTAFIPFKTPAGHPEVVDTDTYVDYLIEDEFGKNASKAVRRSSRRFLRVLEGGTQTSRHFADTAPSHATYAPRHFSTSEAAEA